MGDGAGALDATTRGLAMLRALATADPKNVEAQHDLAFGYSEQGVALMTLGRDGEAKTAFREAIAIRERLIAADPANQEDVRDNKRDRAFLQKIL
jgi:Flp pilus assembly protein TadD